MFKMNFLKMRTKNALKNNKTERGSKPYKQASTVGIVFSVEDKQKHQDVKDFIHLLEKDGKKVTVLEYLPEKKENFEFKFDFFTIQELNFWGTLESPAANKFTDTAFDYLFYVDRESNPLLLNLLARCKAQCRIGRFDEDEREYFELMIEQKGTNKGLIEAMYSYTSQLR
jgi:hypothetical protein